MIRRLNRNVRTEPDTKSGAEAVYSSFGLSLSDAINVFLNMSIIEGGFPFAVMKSPEGYGKNTLKNAVQNASHQSDSIIIDLRRTTIKDQDAVKELQKTVQFI